jgi:hypothetical protein
MSNNLADMLASQIVIETQEHNRKGYIREVVFAGFSTTSPNTLNFRVRYRPFGSEDEAWTTYQIALPDKGYSVERK